MRRLREKIGGWIGELIWRAVARDQRKIRAKRHCEHCRGRRMDP